MFDIGVVTPTHPGPFHVGEFRLRHCPGCDVVFLDPPPTTGDLHKLYQDSVQFSSEHYTDPERVSQILEYLGSAIKNQGLLPRKGGRCLEVGAGLAWMCRACKQYDPTTVTVAQDVSNEAVNLCPWVDSYYVGEAEGLAGEALFDLISMTHVIEHLVEPQKMLVDLSGRLMPKGKMFVTAPFRPEKGTDWRNINAWKAYSYLHVPAHVSYLSETWFRRVGDSAGLTLEVWDPSHENGQAFEAILTKS